MYFNRTFLNLLASVGYDTSTALIVLEIILSCESAGEPLPAEIALIEASDRLPLSAMDAPEYFGLVEECCAVSFFLFVFLLSFLGRLPNRNSSCAGKSLTRSHGPSMMKRNFSCSFSNIASSFRKFTKRWVSTPSLIHWSHLTCCSLSVCFSSHLKLTISTTIAVHPAAACCGVVCAEAAGAEAQAAAGCAPASPRQPYSVREVIRHFHYVWMYVRSPNLIHSPQPRRCCVRLFA